MSLYRQTGERGARLLVALLLGGLAGYIADRGSVEEPSAAEVVANARESLGPVELGLEQVPIEYEGAVGDDGRVAAPTEYEAARATAARTEAALEAAGEDMREIDPAGYAAAKRAIADLSAAVNAVAPQARVEALAAAAAARVESLAR